MGQLSNKGIIGIIGISFLSLPFAIYLSNFYIAYIIFVILQIIFGFLIYKAGDKIKNKELRIAGRIWIMSTIILGISLFFNYYNIN